jgi:hypothetical protein
VASLIEEMAGLLYRELRDRHLSPHTGGYPSQPAEVREQYREVCRRLFNHLAAHSGVVQDPPHAGPGEVPVKGYVRRVHRHPGSGRSSSKILHEGYLREYGPDMTKEELAEWEEAGRRIEQEGGLGGWEDAGREQPAEGAADAGGLGGGGQG